MLSSLFLAYNYSLDLYNHNLFAHNFKLGWLNSNWLSSVSYCPFIVLKDHSPSRKLYRDYCYMCILLLVCPSFLLILKVFDVFVSMYLCIVCTLTLVVYAFSISVMPFVLVALAYLFHVNDIRSFRVTIQWILRHHRITSVLPGSNCSNLNRYMT